MTTPTPRRIAIGANAHQELVTRLQKARPDLEFRGNKFTDITSDDLQWADGYIGFKRPPHPTMGNVQWVHCTGAGVDAWLYPNALPNDILLTRTSESFGPRIAEWVLARALAFTQQLFALRDAQLQQRWEPRDPGVLRGARVLVVGTGDIGSSVASLFAAFGCDITGVNRSGTANPARFPNAAPVSALPTLVGTADYIVLTVPLTDDTRHMFDRALLQQCRGAMLLNVGRGAVVDESALPEALAEGWLKSAALDVFEVEPLPAESPLWLHPQVMVSPHISGVTDLGAAVAGFLECLQEIETTGTSRWRVDRSRGY